MTDLTQAYLIGLAIGLVIGGSIGITVYALIYAAREDNSFNNDDCFSMETRMLEKKIDRLSGRER